MTRQRIDRYEIKNEIGRGGMATVYYAYDPRVKRDVAIKLLLAQLTDDPMLRERFESEAAIIAALDHPAIVPVYDYGEDKRQPYIVMRYMAGGSLESRLQKQGSLPLDETARIVERIAAALDQAHAQGLVHRDLKPGNILFDQYGDAYLSDFGIAHIIETGSMAKRRGQSKRDPDKASLTGGGLLGTPNYISPEQVVGAEVDARSDVYSLAVLLYAMLAGRPPYEAETPTAVALKHISDPVPDIHSQRAKLPPDIQAILEHGMAKEREDRYPTAGELAEDVLSVAGLAGIGKRTPGSGEFNREQIKAKLEADKAKAGQQAASTQAAAPPSKKAKAKPRPEKQREPLPPPRRRPEPQREPARRRGCVRPVTLLALLALIGAAALWATGQLPPYLQQYIPSFASVAGYLTSPPAPTALAEVAATPTPTETAASITPTQEPAALTEEAGVPTTVAIAGATANPPTLTPDAPTETPTSVPPTQTPAPTIAAPSMTPLPGAATPVGGGSRIAYAAGVESSMAMDLFLLNLADGSTTQLTFDAADNRSPVWSPDGTQIVFRAKHEGRRVIFVIRTDGSSAPVALTDSSSDNYAPAWSPDGRRIAFVSERDGNPEIYVMNADGSSPIRLTNTPANDYSPAWSPDGSRLAYFSNVSPDGGQDIYSMNADGSSRVRLTNNPAHDYMPAWSPDGTRIAFVSERDRNAEIYIMNADGSAQTRLTNHSAADLYPAWSPDGQLIVFTSRRDGNNELYIMRADGSEVTRLTFSEDGDLDPRWGP